MIDNNDSFTYNIVELIRRITDKQLTVKNSFEIHAREVAQYQAVIFSPGPSLPDDFPIMKEILRQYDEHLPILGICLGHQAICEYYGARIEPMKEVLHGVESEIVCESQSLLLGGEQRMTVGRYHSWHATDIPSELMVTAIDRKGCVMAVEHKYKPVYGVQFHPESYITKGGEMVIKNFLDAASRR